MKWQEKKDFEFCDNKCTDKDEYIDCKNCIKKYFTKKATDNVGEQGEVWKIKKQKNF